MNDKDEWSRWDADQVAYYADNLLVRFRWDGRLPFPSGAKVREAHRKLGEIVAKMDEKQKEIAA